MNNKEKYKKAFSVLRASDDNLSWEVKSMAKLQKKQKMGIAAAAIMGCILIGGTGTAYAANIGGIQRTVQLWIHGDQTTATLTMEEDGTQTYKINYSDENGDAQEIQGGGISMDADGQEHPLTEADIEEELNAPDVEYYDDGSVWVYYKNQEIDITDKFDDEKICYLKIEDGEDTLYLTIKYENGFCISQDAYQDPSTFNY